MMPTVLLSYCHSCPPKYLPSNLEPTKVEPKKFYNIEPWLNWLAKNKDYIELICTFRKLWKNFITLIDSRQETDMKCFQKISIFSFLFKFEDLPIGVLFSTRKNRHQNVVMKIKLKLYILKYTLIKITINVVPGSGMVAQWQNTQLVATRARVQVLPQSFRKR